MENKKACLHFTLIIIIFSFLIVGCQEKSVQSVDESTNDHDELNPPTTETVYDPLPTKENQAETGKNNHAQISSSKPTVKENDAPKEDALPSAPKEEVKHEPIYDSGNPYNPIKPTLIGLTIHQAKEEIQIKFGNPMMEYVMEDPQDPITVMEYNGFLIGYNKNNQIAFIDVQSSQVNPGLNGLRIGDTVDAVIEILGQPDTKTDFVMNYKSNEINLKFDVDPTTNQIHSIKLFGL